VHEMITGTSIRQYNSAYLHSRESISADPTIPCDLVWYPLMAWLFPWQQVTRCSSTLIDLAMTDREAQQLARRRLIHCTYSGLREIMRSSTKVPQKGFNRVDHPRYYGRDPDMRDMSCRQVIDEGGLDTDGGGVDPVGYLQHAAERLRLRIGIPSSFYQRCPRPRPCRLTA
jgi:hypothetical protein